MATLRFPDGSSPKPRSLPRDKASPTKFGGMIDARIRSIHPKAKGCREMDNPFRIGDQTNRREASILESRTGPSHYKQTVLKTYDL
ncbi:unnamed protein product [Amaranthus hypochondriacus]